MFRILIVDDTKSIHSFVNNLLSKSKDIQSTSVFNGALAAELLKQRQDFDLILLDWEMPVLNGPSTFDEFLRMGIKIPTVMMTTKNAPEDIQLMLSKGVAEYLMKPFTIDILFEKIEYASGKVLSYAA